MLNWLKNGWRMAATQSTNWITKASRTGPMTAYHVVGKPVWTPKNYISLAAEGFQKNVIVYRCINLIARSIASIPWLLYSQKSNGEHEIEAHPLLDLLRSPSPRQAGCAFMEAVVGHLLLAGNAYIEAVFDAKGRVCELYPLRPDRMQVVPHENGDIAAYEYRVNGQSKRIDIHSPSGFSPVLHLKTFHPLNDWYGFSPIEAACFAIDQHNTVAGHNMALMQNGGRPSGALVLRHNEYSNALNAEQVAQIRQDFKNLYEGQGNAGRVMFLEGDFEWKEMGLSPRDLDFIEGKNLAAREIAQAYGVPPMLVGVPGDATFANYREARLHLWEDTILPLLEFLVAELNLWLTPLYKGQLRIGYDLDSIPALAPKREALWERIQNAHFLTVNEKRQAVGYTPLVNGDVVA
jgi:HK97 family phage portal protein